MFIKYSLNILPFTVLFIKPFYHPPGTMYNVPIMDFIDLKNLIFKGYLQFITMGKVPFILQKTTLTVDKSRIKRNYKKQSAPFSDEKR